MSGSHRTLALDGEDDDDYEQQGVYQCVNYDEDRATLAQEALLQVRGAMV
jgi:hypothetical protein